MVSTVRLAHGIDLGNQPSEDELRKIFLLVRSLIEKLSPVYDALSKIEEDGEVYSENRDIKWLSRSNPALFAKKFFFKNLVKCAAAYCVFGPEIKNVRRVIDLGTGPGTFMFSFSAIIKNVDLIGIDLNASALLVAERLFYIAKLPKPLLIQAEVPSAVASGGRFFTASYLLAELSDVYFNEFSKMASWRTDAQFLIVDYPKFAYAFAEKVSPFRRCYVRSFNIQLPSDIADRVGDDRISFSSVFSPISTSSSSEISRQLEESRHWKVDRTVR